MQSTIPRYILKNEEKEEAASQVEEMAIGDKIKIKINFQLTNDHKKKLRSLLQENINNFTEHSGRMFEIDCSIIEHSLEANPSTKPV